MRDTFKSDFPKFVYFIVFLSAVVSYCIYMMISPSNGFLTSIRKNFLFCLLEMKMYLSPCRIFPQRFKGVLQQVVYNDANVIGIIPFRFRVGKF